MNLSDIKHRSEFGNYLESNSIEGVGVEVGVFRGEFANQILTGWKRGCLIGVDCYNHGTEFHLLYDAIKKNRDFIEFGTYTIMVCSSVEGAYRSPDGLAFVYLDAGHTYPEVSADIYHWRKKIRPGGILCGHDFEPSTPGVSRAVEEFMNKDRNLKLHLAGCGSWFVQL